MQTRTIFEDNLPERDSQQQPDRTRFELDEDKWNAFQQVLNRPVQHKPQLEKLLKEPGLLD